MARGVGGFMSPVGLRRGTSVMGRVIGRRTSGHGTPGLVGGVGSTGPIFRSTTSRGVTWGFASLRCYGAWVLVVPRSSCYVRVWGILW